MAKSIQQAEAELRTAALAFSIADAEYCRQWALNREGEKRRNKKGSLIGKLSPGTQAALNILHVKTDELHAAARALDAAAEEHPAEAPVSP